MPPDAVVIIRGGGAVNDMAWLNDYDLARYICDLPIPVWTGIGHERDNTVLDEVAHTRFDTPSKVIAGIEKLISSRVFETQANFEQIANLAARATQSSRAMVGTLDMTVKVEALRHLAQGKQEAVAFLSGIRMDAMQGIRSASEQSRDALQGVKSEAATQLAHAKRDVPAFWGQISSDAKHARRTVSAQSEVLMGNVLERAQRDAVQARQTTDDALDVVSTTARLLVREGGTRSEALMREIAGQGPEKTLNRGFAIVRNQGGAPLTRAAQTTEDTAIEIQFSDGRVSAVTGKQL